MPTLQKENIGPGKVKLLITVAPEVYEKHVKRAASALQNKHDIPGFRRGSVPYDIIKRHFGEMKLLSEALPDIINDSYREALIAEQLRVAPLQPSIVLKK